MGTSLEPRFPEKDTGSPIDFGEHMPDPGGRAPFNTWRPPATRLSRTLSILGKVVPIVAILGIVALGALLAWNWTYLDRLFTYPADMEVTNVAWYEPKELVLGAPGEDLPEEDAKQEEVAPQALERAALWAARKNSSALLVLHNGKLLSERYWKGHDRFAVSNSMAMAKTVVGLLVGIAIAEGKIRSEDEFAATYLPELARDQRRAITIKHLLEMCSGLRYDDDAPQFRSTRRAMDFGTDISSVVLSIPPARAPGKKFEYQSANTQLLGLILERATGRRYADYLSEKLWRPLAAANAAVWLDRPGGMPKTYCGLFATARDWAQIGLLFLNQGMADERQVVPREWIKKMITPSELEPDYGFHIWLGYDPGGLRKAERQEPFPGDLYYLDGEDQQRVYIVPSRSLVIVRLGENAGGFDDSFLPNIIIKGMPHQAEPASSR
jgi:CubicO group peptidase (beta-lactamase class C family)